ncbi:NAD(P)H-dependent oxidoreductase [Plantactinospora sp. GCM10030261]|uniref:NAD(P)H-dependent oxidoreductase n=1 Tax=Plantactinospora sp. GCM10030261 TaxID=3273420 RepID=UPI003606970E
MIVLGHPRAGSFCHALSDQVRTTLAAASLPVTVYDLYAEGFEPVRGGDALVERHRDELAHADGLVVVHPNWWGKPPAIVAGWLDRVIVPGVAYELPDAAGEPTGLLRLRGAVVLNTGDTPLGRERDVFGDPLDAIWRRCVLDFCGVPPSSVHRRLFGPLASSTERDRAAWLAEAADLCGTTFAER